MLDVRSDEDDDSLNEKDWRFIVEGAEDGDIMALRKRSKVLAWDNIVSLDDVALITSAYINGWTTISRRNLALRCEEGNADAEEQGLPLLPERYRV